MNRAQDCFLNEISAHLKSRECTGLLRRPVMTTGHDFHSNDYLGLGRDEALARQASSGVTEMGVGGARLLAGHRPATEALEARFANHVGRHSSLLFSSGFTANIGVIPALASDGDAIFSDALNHASLIDGMRLSRADTHVFPHRDLDALQDMLQRSTARHRLIVTESLFSMDGHRADLTALATIAAEQDALLIVDEAHTTGVFGPLGAGLVAETGLQDEVLLTIHTGGKALGSGGAFVAADSVIIDHLTNHCRSFIYSTAPIPMLIESLNTALDVLENDPSRHLRLTEAITHLGNGLTDLGFSDHDDGSPILPLIVGTPERAMTCSQRLFEAGFAARAVRPPTVPDGTARLRITAHADIDEHTRDEFLRSLRTVLESTSCMASS